jgi:hypothetical protein
MGTGRRQPLEGTAIPPVVVVNCVFGIVVKNAAIVSHPICPYYIPGGQIGWTRETMLDKLVRVNLYELKFSFVHHFFALTCEHWFLGLGMIKL